MRCDLTIFTPTYNRGYILNTLYESLKRQTCKAFEWIVIDDASSDDTELLVRSWAVETKDFYICYYKINHGGKHRAFNKAVKLARSQAFFTVDSDDYLVDNAVEKIIAWFKKVENDDKFAGISGMRGYNETSPIGGTGNINIGEYIDATNLERDKFHLQGDKAEIYKTAILKKYPFVEFPNEYFITEATVWNLIAMNGYKIRWYNEIIYVGSYLEDGLTYRGNELFYKNPRGWLYWLYIKGKYALAEDMLLEYMCWYIYNHNSSLVYYMPELYRHKVNRLLEEGISYLNQYIKKRKIKTYAIYGLGNWGEMFWKMRECVNASLNAGIDERVREWKNIPVYGPEQLYKIDVDMILVTQKNKSNHVYYSLNKFRGYKLFFRDLFILS